MLADTAVAVHPEDDRYNEHIGKYAVLPIVGRKLIVIGDKYVDREFGTGCLKVTPAHDMNGLGAGPQARAGRHLHLHRRGPALRGGRSRVRRDDHHRGAREDRGPAQGERPPGEDRGPRPQRGRMLPLQERGRAPRLHPVVRVREAPGRKGAQGSGERRHPRSTPRRGTRPTTTGWTTSATGASRASLWWGHRIPAWTCDECGELVVPPRGPHRVPQVRRPG